MYEAFGIDRPQVQVVARAFYRLLEGALEANAADAALELAFFPTRMLARGLRWNRSEPFELMLRYPSIYRLARRYENLPERKELGAAIARRSIDHPIEALDYLVPGAIRHGAARVEVGDSARSSINTALLYLGKAMLDLGDVKGFDEGVRKWKLAIRDEPDEDLGEGRAGPIDSSLLALAFWAAYLSARGRLTDPWPWIRRLRTGWAVQRIVDAVERQLAGPPGLDLADWILEDLPSREVHLLNTTSDLLRALVMLLAISDRPLRLSVGAQLYGHRVEAERAIEWATEMAADEDLASRTRAAGEALVGAFATFAAQERTRIRTAALDQGRLADMPDLIEQSLANEFPFSLLLDVGSVRRVDRQALPADRSQTVHVSVPRRLLTEPRDDVEAEVPTIEKHLTNLVRRGLEHAVVTALEASRPLTRPTASALDRIQHAMARHAPDKPFTHLWLPLDWELRGELAAQGVNLLLPGVPTLALGVAMAEWPKLSDAHLLRLPSALRFTWYVANGRIAHISVTELPEESSPDEPRVDVAVTVAFEVRAMKKWMRRVQVS